MLVHRADSGQCAIVDDDQNNQSLCKIASITNRGLRKMRKFRIGLLLSLLKSLFNYRRDRPPLQASPACMTLILIQGIYPQAPIHILGRTLNRSASGKNQFAIFSAY